MAAEAAVSAAGVTAAPEGAAAGFEEEEEEEAIVVAAGVDSDREDPRSKVALDLSWAEEVTLVVLLRDSLSRTLEARCLRPLCRHRQSLDTLAEEEEVIKEPGWLLVQVQLDFQR